MENASAAVILAAEYVRGSTDRQEYSTENQNVVNRAYAAAHGMAIVRTYSDEARSGLIFDRREALKQLIGDVGVGNVKFKVILVYDVSRWGRFQDPDEAAYYEYICKRAGLQVIYCAEKFENDGSPFSALFKAMKRASAAEYSRELSVKVFAGQSRLIKLGYRQGGSAGYGLRRLLVDQNGLAKGILARGEWKSIATDRVVLTLGPADEVDSVRWIFKAFAKQRKSQREIARILNRRKIANVRGSPWHQHHVHNVLVNENYIGNVVWNRQSVKLKGKLVNNSPDKWIRVEGVLEATIEQALFEGAQAIIREGSVGLSQDEKLEPLRRLLRKHGTLSARLISRSTGTPSVSSYERWFGGLLNAYALVGFNERRHCRSGRPRRSRHAATRVLSDTKLLELLKGLYQAHGYLTRKIINETDGIPSSGTYSRRFGNLEKAYDLIGLPGNLANRPPRRPRRSTVSLSDAQLLEALRGLLRTRGRLTRKIIDEAEGVPATATYQRRFGGITPAYDLIGYSAKSRALRSESETTRMLSDEELLNRLRRLLRKRRQLSARIIDNSKGVPSYGTYRRRFGSLKEVLRRIGIKPRRSQ